MKGRNHKKKKAFIIGTVVTAMVILCIGIFWFYNKCWGQAMSLTPTL